MELTVTQKIGALQLDLTSQIEFISALTGEIEDIKNKNEKIDRLETEYSEIKRHISLLASIISQQDTSENDGSSLTLR
ncbi:hypothetical protein LZ641_05065 [Hafnia paralvei]|uniref:hypothetical protein n=1 Tax=Hafnia paralvei TaxID=546367 RepID=UPI001F15E769|nr:hypothetical protein [Hafnia paralvei]MCE9879704.1 hypothetical protein [Hafnia paralvei]MCE9909172.1 hypothetical protein [Hafnia paralvei]MCE9913930.1 hypothetical protein [Hafnia paralvei]